MKHILFISTLLVFGLASCKQTQQVEISEIKPSTQVVKSNMPKKKVSPSISEVEPLAIFPFDIELKDVQGKIHKSDKIFKQNGKPTVLFFWLTTCMPCHMKLNAIKPLYPQWQEELDFNAYAISGDFPKNYQKFVKQTRSKNWEWETYNDVHRAFRDVLPGGLNGYPQTFIFDKDGKLVYQDKKYRHGDELRLFEKIKEICEG